MPELIAVVGPTAAGKSELALRLCEAFDGELVSVDSMQIYRGMDIGTAKPTSDERARIPHHLIDVCDPDRTFSAAEFADLAHRAIADIRARGKMPVLCGGTGLYMDSIVNRLSFGEMKADGNLRDELRSLAEKEGASALHRILEEEDPVAAAAIHENNVKRVIRAIEICRNSGMTKTDWDEKAARAEKPYDALWIGVGAHDRQTLYERADKRVDLMVNAGLPDEVRRLWETGCFEKNSTASAAIGYKEFFPFLRGESSLDACTENLKIATRHYIKRQLTWLNRNEKIRWFYREDYADGEEMFRSVFQEISRM